MEQGRCLGLVGGLGPGATVHYYNALLRAHAAQGIAPDILIAHADLGRVLGAVGRGDNEGLARYLAGLIERLARAGAEVAAVAAVTPHICTPVLRGLSPLPLVDMAEESRAGLAGRGLGRIALFGTRFTVEMGMFGQLAGFNVVRPTAAEIARVHDIYLAIVEAGTGTPPQLEELRRVAHCVIEREGVEAVVLAGTELRHFWHGDHNKAKVVERKQICLRSSALASPRRKGLGIGKESNGHGIHQQFDRRLHVTEDHHPARHRRRTW